MTGSKRSRRALRRMFRRWRLAIQRELRYVRERDHWNGWEAVP